VTAQFAIARGSRVHLNLTDQVDLIIAEEIFVDGIYPLESLTFDPDTVIDCGACAGMFTLLARARYPDAKYHVFEPEPTNITRINRNLALNEFDVALHECAVGCRAGQVHFSGNGFGGRVNEEENAGITVKLIDFPNWLSTIKTERLLLKIDIEGAEDELLPLLPPLLPPSTVLFLETHHDEKTYLGYLQSWFDAGFTHTIVRKRAATETDPDYVEHVLIRN
jgi:FkbM family methyltransferase